MIHILVALVLWFPTMLLRGYAIVKLWGWFGEPQFPNLWHPTIYSAVGLALFIAIMWPIRIDPPDTEASKKYPYWGTSVALAVPLTVIAVGWLWRWVML